MPAIQQSVCRWCFPDLKLNDLAQHAARIGLKGIDLVGPRDWPTLIQHVLRLVRGQPVRQMSQLLAHRDAERHAALPA